MRKRVVLRFGTTRLRFVLVLLAIGISNESHRRHGVAGDSTLDRSCRLPTWILRIGIGAWRFPIRLASHFLVCARYGDRNMDRFWRRSNQSVLSTAGRFDWRFRCRHGCLVLGLLFVLRRFRILLPWLHAARLATIRLNAVHVEVNRYSGGLVLSDSYRKAQRRVDRLVTSIRFVWLDRMA